MGIPLWRHHPYNPDNWKKEKAKSETEPAAATQPRSIIRRATVRDPRTSAIRRRERNIDASFEEFERENRRRIAEANAETSRPETRHGEQDEHSLLDDFPPLRRMPGRMFRTRTLRSPPPPPPPATSRQLPPWRGHVDRSNGLGDRERSWSPGEDHWQMELSTLEPLDDITAATPPPADPDAHHVPDQPTAFTIEESEARAILSRLRQCADRISHVFESLRIRTANARLSTSVENEALETLRHRLAALEETEEKLNELETYFDLCKRRLEDRNVESTTQDSWFLAHAMPALRDLLEDLDNMSNNFDSMWSPPQSGSTPTSPIRPIVSSTAIDAAASLPSQPDNRLMTDIQSLLPSISWFTIQCREMHEQLKSWRELFQRPSIEAQQLRTFITTISGVEELLADVNIMSRRATILMNTITRPMTDTDAAAMESEFAMHQQQLETFNTRFESLERSRIDLMAHVINIRPAENMTTATTGGT